MSQGGVLEAMDINRRLTTIEAEQRRRSTERLCYVAPDLFHIEASSPPVTIFGQQSKGLLLADALGSRLKDSARVAVVGGGLGGLTFAMTLLAERGDIMLTIFDPLFVDGSTAICSQMNDSRRFIHPHIFDWPSAGWFRPRADLPVFSWSAGTVGDNVKQWQLEFDNYVEYFEDRLSLEGARVDRVVREGANLQFKIDAHPTSGELNEHFDAVVVAIGPGVEFPGESVDDSSEDDRIEREPYWSSQRPVRLAFGDNVWVIGGGDGAVIRALSLAGPGTYRDIISELQMIGASGRANPPLEVSVALAEGKLTPALQEYVASSPDLDSLRDLLSRRRSGVDTAVVGAEPTEQDSIGIVRLVFPGRTSIAPSAAPVNQLLALLASRVGLIKITTLSGKIDVESLRAEPQTSLPESLVELFNREDPKIEIAFGASHAEHFSLAGDGIIPELEGHDDVDEVTYQTLCSPIGEGAGLARYSPEFHRVFSAVEAKFRSREDL